MQCKYGFYFFRRPSSKNGWHNSSLNELQQTLIGITAYLSRKGCGLGYSANFYGGKFRNWLSALVNISVSIEASTPVSAIRYGKFKK